jgi:hypothetical protein
MSSPVFPSGYAVYAGANMLRRSVTQFLQYMFSNIEYLTDDLRWTSNIQTTKITIVPSYPLGEKTYPSIIVTTVRPETKPLYLGEISYQDDFSIVTGANISVSITGTVTGFATVYTVNHNYDVSLKISDMNLNSAELIADKLMLLFPFKKIRDLFMSQYGCYLDPSSLYRSSDYVAVPLGGTNSNEYSFNLSFRVFWQGEVIVPEDVETITHESMNEDIYAES